MTNSILRVFCPTKRVATRQPGLIIAGALAANLIRLIVPLLALAFLQSSAAEAYWGETFQNYAGETLVASYLVLLLLDILLHIVGYGGGIQTVQNHDSE